jgi:hypothetical protein
MRGKKALVPVAVLPMGCSERRPFQQTLLRSRSSLRDASINRRLRRPSFRRSAPTLQRTPYPTMAKSSSPIAKRISRVGEASRAGPVRPSIL